MKRVTMKDIAKEAGVSVATVSYVLNNIEEQKIPQETKDKIFEISRQMNYIPNLTARALVKRRSGMIGIFVMKDSSYDCPWRYYDNSVFIDELEGLLTQSGYHVLIKGMDSKDTEMNIISQRALDGVFIMRPDKESFFKISHRFNVPIIIVDGFIDDKLFHKLIFDYCDAIMRAKALLGTEDIYIITTNLGNDEMTRYIIRSANIKVEDILTINTYNDIEKIEEFISLRPMQKGIIINEFAGIAALKYANSKNVAIVCNSGAGYMLPEDVSKIMFDNVKKAHEAHDLMINYINGEYSEAKYSYIKAD